MTRGIGEGDVVEHDVAVLHLPRRRATRIVLAGSVQNRHDVVRGLLRQLVVGRVGDIQPHRVGSSAHHHVNHHHLNEGDHSTLNHHEADEQHDNVVNARHELRETVTQCRSPNASLCQLVGSVKTAIQFIVQNVLQVVRVHRVDVQHVVRQVARTLHQLAVHLFRDSHKEVVLHVHSNDAERRQQHRKRTQSPVAQRRETHSKRGCHQKVVLRNEVKTIHQVANASCVDAQSRHDNGRDVKRTVVEAHLHVDVLLEGLGSDVGDEALTHNTVE